MDTFITVAVGILIIVLGWLLIFRQMIGLLHSYHYKRVEEKDKPALCKWSGIGVMLTGAGILTLPFISHVFGILLVAIGLALSLGSIIKYNHGLF